MKIFKKYTARLKIYNFWIFGSICRMEAWRLANKINLISEEENQIGRDWIKMHGGSLEVPAVLI